MNNPNRCKAIVYAVVLVVFGGIIGAMVMTKLSPPAQTLRLGRVDEISATIRQRLTAKLDLTPDQKTRLEPMIKQAAEEMEAIHLDCLNRITKAADDLHAHIRPELIKEQQEKLIELETERAGRLLAKYNYRRAGTNAVTR